MRWLRGLQIVVTLLCLVLPTLLLASQGAALPAAPLLPAALQQRIDTALASRQDSDPPRTRHLLANGQPRFTNRLILESSPYLLQHAHNPVNWYPWGDAAFAAARDQHKSILLSIGYSTCHWCHVMERESFDNVEIAEYLNANYIAIKVDREERPDIDRIYAAVVEAFGSNPGWPMTVWLTPDRQPFYAGSYYPAYDGDRGVERGFLTLLRSLHAVWDENQDGVGRVSDKLVAAVRRRMVPVTGTSMPSDAVFSHAYQTLRNAYDPVNGGLIIVPKFASHLPTGFLLRYHHRFGDADALDMATHTLEQMARGGIHDQIGGGFHRYATDAQWQVPHFEKMLYDNALLAIAYLEAFRLSGEAEFERVCRQILQYAIRDMQAPGGAFYSASDADSRTADGAMLEGAFFTWRFAELESFLNAPELQLVAALYGVDKGGPGRSVLHISRTAEELADELGLDPAQLAQLSDIARQKVYRARSARPPPFRDTKILTAWNGLMVSAFARASLYLDEPSYLAVAERAAHFLLDNMMDESRLSRVYVQGAASGVAFADDYAYLIQALIDLYEASGDIEWFQSALRLQRQMTDVFLDADDGGYFYSAADANVPLSREKSGFDGDMPSANAIAVLNLLRLYKFTSDDDYRLEAERVLTFFGDVMRKSPTATSWLLSGLDFHNQGGKEIVIVTPGDRAGAAPFLAQLRSSFAPNDVLVVVRHGAELERHAEHVRILEGKIAIRGAVTAYVCEHGVCDLPTSDVEVFAAQIKTGGRE